MCIDNKKVTVIVPIYNVEQYLSRCIESIICQTYRELEIILVDDGGKDNCGKICDEYAAKDDRIIVIHQENSGVARSRNVALDIATGDYILFIDGDDYYTEDAVSCLLQDAEDTDLDVIGFEIQSFHHEEDRVTQSVRGEKVVLSREDIIRSMPTMKSERAFLVTNKLFPRKLFEGLRFREGIIHEDNAFMTHMLERIDSVLWDQTVYYRRQLRPDGIMGTQNRQFNMNSLDILVGEKERCDLYFGKEESDIVSYAFATYLGHLIRFYCRTTCIGEVTKAKELYIEFCREYDTKKAKVQLKARQKVLYRLFRVAPKILGCVLAPIFNK